MPASYIMIFRISVMLNEESSNDGLTHINSANLPMTLTDML